MFEIGRMCVKLAGRDAGKKCVVVDIVDDKNVLIDGAVRRRKCNTMHLEPMDQTIQLSKGASHEHVVKAFSDLGIESRTTKPKAKKPKETVEKPVVTKEVKPKKVVKKKA